MRVFFEIKLVLKFMYLESNKINILKQGALPLIRIKRFKLSNRFIMNFKSKENKKLQERSV